MCTYDTRHHLDLRDLYQAPKHGSRYRMDGSELHGPACANSPPPPSPPPHSPPPRPPPPPSPPYHLCPSHRHPCRRPRRRQQSRSARPSRAAPLPCVCVAHGRGVHQGSASEEAVVICLHSACGCSVTARDTDSPMLAGVAGFASCGASGAPSTPELSRRIGTAVRAARCACARQSSDG